MNIEDLVHKAQWKLGGSGHKDHLQSAIYMDHIRQVESWLLAKGVTSRFLETHATPLAAYFIELSESAQGAVVTTRNKTSWGSVGQPPQSLLDALDRAILYNLIHHKTGTHTKVASKQAFWLSPTADFPKALTPEAALHL